MCAVTTVTNSCCRRLGQQQRTVITPEMGTEVRVPTPPLPAGTKPLGNQVAGHFHGQGKTKLGFLEYDNGTILKPIQSLPRGLRELEFYKEVFDPESRDNILVFFRPLVPKYLGVFVERNIDYILMENVTDQFESPCIMDIKMGQITYDPEASQAKIDREILKYGYIQQVGFQILGQRVYKPKTSEYKTFGKLDGRRLAPEKIPECLSYFFNCDHEPRADAISVIIEQLTNIENWFLQQKRFRFFAVSLLVVYEGELGQSAPPKVADVRMIDFAHVFPADQRDDNFLYGLQKLKKYLESLLERAREQQIVRSMAAASVDEALR